MKRSSWSDYQKEIADDKYYYVRSCIRQNFFPGSEKAFLNMLQKDLGRDVFDDPLHTSCTGIGYHSDIVPLDTIMTVVARQFALRQPRDVARYLLPQLHAMNFVLDDVLDGGVNDSLNLDSHGKALSYLLLDLPVQVPAFLSPHFGGPPL